MHAADPARYLSDARRAYCLSTTDVSALQRSLLSRTPAKIVYHSHIDVGAYFSMADQQGALCNEEPAFPVEYVVIDIQDGRTCTAKQYAWNVKHRTYVEVRSYV